jgi:HEAT repeat protein
MQPANLFRFALRLTTVAVVVGSVTLSAQVPQVPSHIAERIREGLSAREAKSVSERREGADSLVSVGVLHADELAKSDAGREMIARTAASIREWLSEEREMWVRRLLVQALGGVSFAENRQLLTDLTGDSDPSIRLVAAGYLSGRWVTNHEKLAPPEEAALVQRTREEGYWWVKSELLLDLGHGTGPDSLDLLHGSLADSVRDIRAAALEAIGERADRRSLPVLLPLLDAPRFQGSDTPVYALGDIADAGAAGAVARLARSPSPVVRSAVAWALGRMRQSSSIPVVTSLLQDENPAVRNAALRSLRVYGTVEAALPLLRALGRRSSDEQLNDALDLGKTTIAEACLVLMAEPGVSADDVTGRRRVCDWLQRPNAQRVSTWSSADLHARIYSSSNPDARVVRPMQGGSAEAWKDAVGKTNGGTRENVQKGERLTIWSAALYGGETWFEVARGPHADHVWIRERDVERVSDSPASGRSRESKAPSITSHPVLTADPTVSPRS